MPLRGSGRITQEAWEKMWSGTRADGASTPRAPCPQSTPTDDGPHRKSAGPGDPGRRDVGWIVISAEGEHDGRLLERDRELERIGRCLQRAGQGHGGALGVA